MKQQPSSPLSNPCHHTHHNTQCVWPHLHFVKPISPQSLCHKHNTMGHWHHDCVRCMQLHTSNSIKPGKQNNSHLHHCQTLVTTTHIVFGPTCTLLNQSHPNHYALNTMQRGTGIMIVLDVCCHIHLTQSSQVDGKTVISVVIQLTLWQNILCWPWLHSGQTTSPHIQCHKHNAKGHWHHDCVTAYI